MKNRSTKLRLAALLALLMALSGCNELACDEGDWTRLDEGTGPTCNEP